MKLLRRLIPFVLVITALVIAFSALAGCSGEDKTNRFNELLGLIPADVDISYAPIILIDYASFYEDNGISLVELDEQSISIQGFIDLILERELQLQLLALGSDITGYGRYAVTGTINDKYVGYSFTNIDAEIQAGAPPANVVAAIGRFDPQATSDALSNQDEWPDWAIYAYTTEKYNGVTVHSWGDGLNTHINPSLAVMIAPPHIDMLGRARPLAITPEYLFYSYSLENVKSMIDSSKDDIESLADLSEFAEITDKLLDFNVYSAVMGVESMVNGDPEYPGTYPGPRLKYFNTFGSAPGKDENGTYMLLILYHKNHEDAEVNVSLLEERINNTDIIGIEIPWTDFITETDIRAEGNLLVAKLYTEGHGLMYNWVYGRDPLLIHEE